MDSDTLHGAARSGDMAAVLRTLAYGADPSGRDEFALTPLMCATTTEVVRMLLEAGARVDDTDDDGMDALGLILLDPDIDERAEMGRVLLEHGAPLDLINRFELGRVASAAFARSVEAVEFFIGRGCSLEPALGTGTTALHLACWHGDAEDADATEKVVEILMKGGIPLNARDCFGQTPLHFAVEGDEPSPASVRVLLKHGAKPDPIDHNGRTPLTLARNAGAHEIVKILSTAGAKPDRCHA